MAGVATSPHTLLERTMAGEKLKPCPFCGAEAAANTFDSKISYNPDFPQYLSDERTFVIRCSRSFVTFECGARMEASWNPHQGDAGRARVIDRWNRRPKIKKVKVPKKTPS